MLPDHRRLQERLEFAFQDPALLRLALVHRSYVNESREPDTQSNERLEFLGDAVVGYLVADHLFRIYPDLDEGSLTSLRSALVRREALAEAARRLDLGSCLLVGRGSEAQLRERDVVLASAFEALIAAVLLDQGLDAARRFILAALGPELEALSERGATKDAKSLFQERIQAIWHVTPHYRTVSAEGPDHAKRFAVDVSIGAEVAGHGVGPTKQLAQQAAAEDGLRHLEAGWQPLVPPPPEGNTRSTVDKARG